MATETAIPYREFETTFLIYFSGNGKLTSQEGLSETLD